MKEEKKEEISGKSECKIYKVPRCVDIKNEGLSEENIEQLTNPYGHEFPYRIEELCTIDGKRSKGVTILASDFEIASLIAEVIETVNYTSIIRKRDKKALEEWHRHEIYV